MWKVYIGQFGKVYEGNKEFAEAVYRHYENLASQRIFWQPFIRLLDGTKPVKEYNPPPPSAHAQHIENALYKVRCKT